MPRLVRTLRFRLAAAFFVWTGLLFVALTVALPWARQNYVHQEVDAKLERAVPLILTRLSQDGITNLNGVLSPLDLVEGEYIVDVRNRDGEVLASTDASVHLPARSGSPWYNTVPVLPSNGGTGIRYRVATTPAEIDGVPVTVSIGTSLASYDRMSRAMVRMLTAALGIGLIASAIGGWIIAGIVARRIERVAKAVREVSPTRLDERVQIPGGNDEIGGMAADLNMMLERMAVAFRSQERFMSEVSHELKTPLSALLTEAQVLKQMRAAPRYSVPGSSNNGSAAEVRKALEPYERFVLSVEEEMRWLGKLVESFLMLARFGHGKQFVAESLVPMNDVVLDAVEHSSLYARQHGVKLALTLYDAAPDQPEAMIKGDAELLRVVADNLIRNAVQFSKKGDSVFVRLFYEAAPLAGANGTLVFTVKDQGPGVPAEYLERIFDRFAQAPGKTASRRGSGLGLTISKSIVDLHAGIIGASNDPEGGCTFRVRLPLNTAPNEPQPSTRPAAEPVAV